VAMIEAIGLSKRYGDKLAVDDLSFRVEPGTVTGFLGPNGSGKSTTIRLMLGLDSGEGTTLFDGRPYRDLDHPARQIGALLDARAFHPGRPARDHLRMIAAGAGIPASRVDEVLHTVGLAAVTRVKPKRFSLGMAQRLGLAAAILGEPHTLILDEPANGLDPQGIRWLRGFLKGYAALGRTVFVSSHLLSEMELMADNLVVIAAGRLVANASVAEFIQSANLATVSIRCGETDRLAKAVAEAGGTVETADGDLLVIAGLSQRAVADLALAQSCPVYELFTRTASLEDSFFAASAGRTEYDAQLELDRS